ncbi:type II toxin-antitoxin system prevent-host-death family antitoxin [Thermus thermophilus]|nr:type II toxin-antitoxin system prevent-host-death family antitoxin [Thermus thermophilus]
MHRKRVFSATEARVHFGEALRRVEEGEVIVVEGRGRPQAVIRET